MAVDLKAADSTGAGDLAEVASTVAVAALMVTDRPRGAGLRHCHHSCGKHYSCNEGSRWRSRATPQVDPIHQLEWSSRADFR